jgi:predicted enzyme related to lactoylglutathione lyase
MTSRLTNICIDASDPASLASFWCAVLGWEIAEASEDGVSIAPADRAWPVIDLLPVRDAKRHKNRVHLDLRADGCGTDEELERLLGLGATPVDVGQFPEVPWVVLSDPEGNEFCLLAAAVQDLAD